MLFESNKQLHVSFGFSNGSFVAEPVKALVQDGVKDSVLVQTKQVTGRVTMLKYLPLFNLLAVGSATGEILLYNLAKGRPYQYFELQGEQVQDILQLPEDCHAKKHLLYLLTSKNCYVFLRCRNFDETRLNKTDSIELTLRSQQSKELQSFGLDDPLDDTENTSLNS